MPDLTTRQREIIAKLRGMDWLRGTAALAAHGTDEELMPLTFEGDLCLDSLELISAALDIENAFNIDLAEIDMDATPTIGDAVALIARKTA